MTSPANPPVILDELVEKLRGATRGLCTEDASGYLPRGVSAADCVEAAATIQRLLERDERMREALALLPDEIEVFRIIRGAHGNSHAVMAKAVARRIDEIRTTLSEVMGVKPCGLRTQRWAAHHRG